jgi:hypothetical protein
MKRCLICDGLSDGSLDVCDDCRREMAAICRLAWFRGCPDRVAAFNAFSANTITFDNVNCDEDSSSTPERGE